MSLAPTAEVCLDDIRRVAELNPNPSRDFYRKHASIREADWASHFGTFAELKRQAGVTQTRFQNRLNLDTARHASVDVMRRMNLEKSGYEGAYLRPFSRRFQTAIHITDVHDIECDPFWRRVFLDVLARAKPEKLIIAGDTFDLPEFGKYGVDPREWDVVGRIRWVHKFLADIREAAPDTEIVMIEGNHEARLLKHLAEAAPGLQAVLSDLHGFTVPRLLGLDKFEVNYIARADLAAFSKRDLKEELNRNYHIAWDCYLAHHFPEGERMGYPGAHGHHHSHWVHQHFSPTFGAFEWAQLGCGHRRHASYCAGEKWGLGFQLVHADTRKKHVAAEYIQIRDFAMAGGKFYTREKNEE